MMRTALVQTALVGDIVETRQADGQAVGHIHRQTTDIKIFTDRYTDVRHQIQTGTDKRKISDRHRQKDSFDR